LNLNRDTVGVGRALKCVFGLCLVSQALGRGHRAFDATLPRSGVPCAPPPCGAAATWPNQPSPFPLWHVPLPSDLAPITAAPRRLSGVPPWLVCLARRHQRALLGLTSPNSGTSPELLPSPHSPTLSVSSSCSHAGRGTAAAPLPRRVRTRHYLRRDAPCLPRPCRSLLGFAPHFVSAAPSPIGLAWHVFVAVLYHSSSPVSSAP
jgi:hypothetical protein